MITSSASRFNERADMSKKSPFGANQKSLLLTDDNVRARLSAGRGSESYKASAPVNNNQSIDMRR